MRTGLLRKAGIAQARGRGRVATHSQSIRAVRVCGVVDKMRILVGEMSRLDRIVFSAEVVVVVVGKSWGRRDSMPDRTDCMSSKCSASSSCSRSSFRAERCAS